MNKGDKRRLTSPLSVRTAFSHSTIPAGEIIEVQQGKDKFNNVLIHDVWMNCYLIERLSVPIEEA